MPDMITRNNPAPSVVSKPYEVVYESLLHVQDKLIGKQVVVTRSARRPRANRFMLGDHSQVDLT